MFSRRLFHAFCAAFFGVSIVAVVVAGTITVASAQPPARIVAPIAAPTPPMGWNSWDAYGLTINEADYKANAQVLASFKSYGWNYAVIDEGWFLENPLNAGKPDTLKYTIDAYGRVTPALNRFPSAANGAGFKPIADYAHSLGLKFGIHIIRGIPKRAVKENLTILNTSLHASDAADTTDTCSWNPDNFGVKENAAGRAYYDSLIALYAGWGVDFLKVDCIADHPYKADEIRMISAAIQKTGRPIVLSLSPGPTQLEHAAEIGEHAQMWRIADDIWDGWEFPGQKWPNGLLSAFDNLSRWSRYARPGNWPDADMLPWGYLGPEPGWGKARQSALTQDEQRTQFTLWAIARTPMILGANLTRLDDFTKSLLANKEVIAINQTAIKSEEHSTYPEDPLRPRRWSAITGGTHPQHYVAIFNLHDKPLKDDEPWLLFGLADKAHAGYDVWNKKHLPPSAKLHVEIPAHGCMLVRVE
ncbi:glycoside hydrolase family 27 protein [Acidicapsa ligni]|uniref:glycoside hydrolase family 27 protein n=1 Tax=Acidicapsa ligni TaxID=542300 RepID=UPI0021DF7BB9|nr:glycoside hydrolase family 27 protein [Acidicapsa ligni]